MTDGWRPLGASKAAGSSGLPGAPPAIVALVVACCAPFATARPPFSAVLADLAACDDTDGRGMSDRAKPEALKNVLPSWLQGRKEAEHLRRRALSVEVPSMHDPPFTAGLAIASGGGGHDTANPMASSRAPRLLAEVADPRTDDNGTEMVQVAAPLAVRVAVNKAAPVPAAVEQEGGTAARPAALPAGWAAVPPRWKRLLPPLRNWCHPVGGAPAERWPFGRDDPRPESSELRI
jgi:hypothetical protein